MHNFFIKCVKPNERMRAAAFHAGYVLRQLRHQGVLQAVAIIKGGFPHRISYNEVHGGYAHLLTQLAASAAPGTQVFASIGPRGLVCALLAAEELTEGTDYVLGRTRVFLRLGKAQLARANALAATEGGPARPREAFKAARGARPRQGDAPARSARRHAPPADPARA